MQKQRHTFLSEYITETSGVSCGIINSMKKITKTRIQGNYAELCLGAFKM